MLAFAFEDRFMASVVAFALEGNARSLAVIERLGFQPEGHFQRPLGRHALFRAMASRPSLGKID